MFSATPTKHLSSSILAGQHLKAWEKTLALRVSLQKPLDLANQLPVYENFDNLNEATLLSKVSTVKQKLRCHLSDACDMLESEVTRSLCSQKAKKRKWNSNVDAADEIIWNDMIGLQESLENRWEIVLNKWHARLNFGSEKAKSKLKVFNQSMWSQIDETLSDNRRSLEKSRLPMAESKRIGRTLSIESDGSANNKKSRNAMFSEEDSNNDNIVTGDDQNNKEIAISNSEHQYDVEVYDDRMFYAMLLKTFITSGSGNGGNGKNSSNGDMMSTMRASDLEALRRYKRKAVNVERKASKGRKVRYTVHDKLQNFMFPVPVQNISGIDTDKLFLSLFQ